MLNIQDFLNKYYSLNEAIILACSTGPDSMFLLYEILKTNYKDNLVVCYFNHKLRDEADMEEKWIEQLGEKLGFKVEIGSADIKAIQQLYPSISLEDLARQKRYRFFNAILNIYNSNYIITAHHLDDKIETFFHNLLRGTKITGLINMTEVSGSILRPLLALEKKDILDYLDKNCLEYKIDITNKDNTITRNKLRNQIIPEFYDINNSFKKNISNTMDYLALLKDFLDSHVKEFLSGKREFKVVDFQKMHIFMQKEIIRYIYFLSNDNSTIGLSEANINEIIKFINSPNANTIKDIHKLHLKKQKQIITF